MELIADMLLAAGAVGAAFYCVVLSRRLTRFTDLQGGVGGAVAALSSQVDEMTRALDRSRRAAGEQSGTLERSTRKAEEVARRLELLVASMHDLPAEEAAPPKAEAPPVPKAPAAKAPAPVPPRAEAASEPEPAPAQASTVVPDIALASAWDDWDPFEVAAPAAPGADMPAADRTPAPGKPLGGRSGGAAPVVALKPAGGAMPIFTAARPSATPEPGARRVGSAE